MKQLGRHEGTVHALALAPDGRTLYSAGADRCVIAAGGRIAARAASTMLMSVTSTVACSGPDGRVFVSFLESAKRLNARLTCAGSIEGSLAVDFWSTQSPYGR